MSTKINNYTNKFKDFEEIAEVFWTKPSHPSQDIKSEIQDVKREIASLQKEVDSRQDVVNTCFQSVDCSASFLKQVVAKMSKGCKSDFKNLETKSEQLHQSVF